MVNLFPEESLDMVGIIKFQQYNDVEYLMSGGNYRKFSFYDLNKERANLFDVGAFVNDFDIS